MASTLSLSVLRFGTHKDSPWFGGRWGSEDIYVFLDDQGKPVSSQCAGKASLATVSIAPHIPAFQSSQAQPLKCRTWPLAENNQLFSLAYVLTELAYGKPFADIECPRLTPPPADNHDTFEDGGHINEYIKLREIVKYQLEYEVGRKFASAVKACFDIDFGQKERDLSKEETRVEYYEKVVRKIQECVQLLEED